MRRSGGSTGLVLAGNVYGAAIMSENRILITARRKGNTLGGDTIPVVKWSAKWEEFQVNMAFLEDFSYENVLKDCLTDIIGLAEDYDGLASRDHPERCDPEDLMDLLDTIVENARDAIKGELWVNEESFSEFDR